MTSPAQPAMPTPATVAPSAVTAPTVAPQASPEITQEGRWGAQDAIASIVGDAVNRTIAEQAPAPDAAPVVPPTEVVREDGATWNETAKRWQGKDGGFVEGAAPAVAAPVVGEMAVTDGEPEPIALPDGFAAIPKVEGRELATTFTVRDKDGELDVPDIQIDFTANGRTRSEPLDKVVKLAQMGVFNQERHEQTVHVQRENDGLKQRVQQVEHYAQQVEQRMQQLLSSDDAYLMARAEFEQQNTPEYRAQMARQELEQTNQQIAFTQAAQAGQQFLATTLEPAVNQIAQALPEVGVEEIGARLLLVSDRFRVHTPFGSIIPPQYHEAVAQQIVQDVAPWAMQLHEARAADKAVTRRAAEQQTAAATAAAERARVEAQKARNLGTRPASPGRRGTPTTPHAHTPPTPPPIRTLDDAEQFSVKDAVAKALAG